MVAALLLAAAAALVSGCVLVPVGPPVVARPAIVAPAPVIVTPGHRGHYRHQGYHGGYRRGHGHSW
jgi:hypothetical protein